MKVTRCGPQKKRPYRTKAIAKMMAARIMKAGHVQEKLRVYKCPWCREWHLTHQPQGVMPSARKEP